MVQGVMFVLYLFTVASIQISSYCGLMVSVNIAFQLAGILLRFSAGEKLVFAGRQNYLN